MPSRRTFVTKAALFGRVPTHEKDGFAQSPRDTGPDPPACVGSTHLHLVVREFDASVMDLDEWWPKPSGIRFNLPLPCDPRCHKGQLTRSRCTVRRRPVIVWRAQVVGAQNAKGRGCVFRAWGLCSDRW